MTRTHIEKLEPRRLLSVFGTDAIPTIPRSGDSIAGDINNDGIDDVVALLVPFNSTQGVLRVEVYASGPHGHQRTQVINSVRNPVLGDMDSDGDLDLMTTGGLSYYFYENVMGTFILDPSRTKTLDTGSPSTIDVIDFDQDGDLDLSLSAGYSYFENDGTGRYLTDFPVPSGYPGLSSFVRVDIDADGDQDYVGNYDASLAVKRNNGSTWSIESLGLTPNYQHPTFGDVDSDGDIDLVYAWSQGGNWSLGFQVAYNDGLGHFPTATFFSPFRNKTDGLLRASPRLIDIDRDGDLDVVCTGVFGVEPSFPKGLVTSLNNGDGTFSGQFGMDTEGTFIVNPSVESSWIAVGDFDGDGVRNDLGFDIAKIGSISARYFGISSGVSIPSYTPLDSPNWVLGEITRADFNHDNITDLVVGSETSSVLLMNSDGSYQSIALDGSTNRPTPSDLDNDGWVDLIDSRDGVIMWWRNVQGQFVSSQILKTINENLPFDRLRFDDFDGNGKIDVILMTQTTQADGVLAKVWLQSSQLQFNDTISVAITGPLDDPADFTDIDGDGDLDVIGRQRSYRLDMNPAPTYIALQNHSNTLTGTLTSLSADFDNDGDLDIASINETNGRIEFLDNQNGEFINYRAVTAPNIRATNRRAIDIDGDRDLDIVAEFQNPATSTRDYVLGIIYNDGEGNFSNVYFDAFPITTLNFELTDFSGDDLPDLLVIGDVSYYSGNVLFVYTSINRLAPDLTAPTVNATFERNIPATRFTFSENVFNSLDEADFELKRLEDNSTINPTQLNLEWEASTNSVLVHYTGSSNGALPDGHYLFTIQSHDVSDASGNTLASDFTFNFNIYAGDINGDGTVNFNDLLIIAQNYGSNNATFDQGDLDYDGDVDFEDLLLVAQRYGTSLPQLRPVSQLDRRFRSIFN